MFRCKKPHVPFSAGKVHPDSNRLVGIAWLLLLLLALAPVRLWADPAAPSPKSYRDLAWECYWKGDYTNAITNFSKAILENPQDAWAYNYRALSKEYVGDLTGALADFKTAAKINPDYAEVYVNCGQLLQWYSNKLSIAIADYTEAIRLEPTNANTFTIRAGAYLRQTNFDKAMSDYNMAIQLQPTNAMFWKGRGDFFKRMTNYDAAILDYTKCIQLEPTNADYYAFRARAETAAAKGLPRNGDQKKADEYLHRALDDWHQAVALDSSHLTGLGTFECQQGKYDQGIADFTKYTQMYPTNVTGLDLRAFAFERMAEEEAKRGELAAKEAALDQALADWNHLMSMDPRSEPLLLCLRGDFYARNNQYAKALADYREAVELQPTHKDPLISLAWFLATCPDPAFRNGTQALAAAKKARDLGQHYDSPPFDGGDLSGLAAAYAETGDFVQAVKFQKQALQLMVMGLESGEYNGAFVTEMQDRLTLYEQGQACHKMPGIDIFD
jgi:tetratricopeptide (TPR) repeat protein